MEKVQKDVLLMTFVGFVAILGLLVLFLHGNGLSSVSLDDESLIGQALKANGCGPSQKATCQRMQNSCTTIKGTWAGDCTSCTIACVRKKK